MTSGGARTRSGPAPSPNSGRSEARGLTFKDLPAEGYQGEIPEFPQPVVFGAERKYWEWAWRTPQAALWATSQWAWVLPAVADWCSLKAQAEDPEAPVSVRAAIRQREGDILLSHDALLRAGYRIVTDQLAERRELSAAPKRAGDDFRARLKAVGDDR